MPFVNREFYLVDDMMIHYCPHPSIGWDHNASKPTKEEMEGRKDMKTQRILLTKVQDHKIITPKHAISYKREDQRL
jgi:hypothetical protein